jgi:hypothetical protein
MRRSIMVAALGVLMTGSVMAQQPGSRIQNQPQETATETKEPPNTLVARLRPPPAPVELVPRLTLSARADLRATEATMKAAAGLRGRSVAYMIAGGALFIGGLLVEGNVGAIMALSGAGIGAYGLYLHFR